MEYLIATGGSIDYISGMNQDIELFLTRCGVNMTDPTMLGILHEDLVAANREINLTRITGLDDYYIRHVADSLSIGLFIPEILTDELTVVDVGCGGGFPMLPLAWANSKLAITGLEPKKKKSEFVAAQIKKHGLENVAVECCQAREHKGQYDLVLARAVGRGDILFRECRKLICPGGRMVMYKTPGKVEEEMPSLVHQCEKYNMSVTRSDIFSLPRDSGQRQFIIVAKSDSTID